MSENYGASALAKKFGVTRYPAIFVGDVLVATPKDFGFYGTGEGSGGGRYAPLRSAEAHDRFRNDLKQMIDLVLAGKTAEARAIAPDAKEQALAQLPTIDLEQLGSTARITNSSLRDKIVLVEFWATWCPPCRSTLAWLKDVKTRYGDKLEVVAVAIESDSSAVTDIARASSLRFALGTPELARAFGDISAVPTMFVFDTQGKRIESAFGAPPDLHEKIESRIAAIAKP